MTKEFLLYPFLQKLIEEGMPIILIFQNIQIKHIKSMKDEHFRFQGKEY
tara:strand:+ start:84 stop:230 length:147 start_codon:yes stop_codon:yes gene_type:complete